MPTVSQTSSINVNTSVLGNVDYRYGNDFALVNSDPINTAFGSTDSVIALPTTNLVYRWKSTGATVVATLLTHWTDSIGSVNLLPHPAGGVGALNDGPNGEQVVLTLGAYVSAVGHGENPGTVCVVFSLDTLVSGNIYDNGNGIVFGYDAALGKFTAFISAVSNMTPDADHWYVAIINNGGVIIYDLSEKIQLDTFNGSSAVGPDGTIKIGSTVTGVLLDIIVYNDIISDANTDLLISYLAQTYYTTMTLPLTLPTGSYPQTN